MHLAGLASSLGRDDVDALSERALEDMLAAGDRRGSVYGYSALIARLTAGGHYGRAGELIGPAETKAAAIGDDGLIALVGYNRARLALALSDLGLARHELLAAQQRLGDDGPAYLRGWILSGLGTVRWALGDLEGSLRAYEAELEP